MYLNVISVRWICRENARPEDILQMVTKPNAMTRLGLHGAHAAG
jgi:hypothetical protein